MSGWLQAVTPAGNRALHAMFTAAVCEVHARWRHRGHMKNLAALVLATSLAAGGCGAHSQTRYTARNVALTTAVIGAIVLTTVLVPCAQCNDTFVSPQDGARR